MNNLSFGLSSSDSENFAPQIVGFPGEANGQRPFASTKSTGGASKVPEGKGEKPKTEVNRIQKVQQRLHGWEVDFLIIDNPIDLFYLTGQDFSVGRLLISEDNAELYVDGRYYEACKTQVPISVKLHSKEQPLFFAEEKRIGYDAHFTTVAVYEKLRTYGGKLIPLLDPMSVIRSVKEPEEIVYLRQAASLGSVGFDFVVALLKKGITEEDIAIELEVFWRKAGGDRLAFSPHIAFGANSAYPHYRVGKHALKQGDCVLIDIGVVLNHYHSDMTRVVFFGQPHRQLECIYHIVREAQANALELCKPGTACSELDKVARDFIEAQGYGDYFVHSLGHGIGLEIHEAPWIRKNASGYLEAGMVLTIEPGVYLPGVGGIRLEDTIVITDSGYENLTDRPILTSLPKTV